MNISLPEALKSFVDQQVRARGYRSSSEYVRELIRNGQDRQPLRGLLLEGAASPPTVNAAQAQQIAADAEALLVDAEWAAPEPVVAEVATVEAPTLSLFEWALEKEQEGALAGAAR